MNRFLVWTEGRDQVQALFFDELRGFPVHQASVLHAVDAKGNQLLHQFIRVYMGCYGFSQCVGRVHDGL